MKLDGTLKDLELLKNHEGAVGHYRQLLLTDLKRRALDEDAPVWRSPWYYKGHEVASCPEAHIQGTTTNFISSLISNIRTRLN